MLKNQHEMLEGHYHKSKRQRGPITGYETIISLLTCQDTRGVKTTRVSPFVLTRVSMVFAFYLILVNVIKDLEEKTVLNVRFI